MSNYLGIHHCEILVTDIDKAMHFYTQILGLEEIHNPSTFQASKWLRLGNQELHLTFVATPDANKERHFAIHVKSLQKLREDFMQNAANPNEIISLGLLHCESEEQFCAEMKRLATSEQIRHDKIALVADKTGENRQYFVMSDDILG